MSNSLWPHGLLHTRLPCHSLQSLLKFIFIELVMLSNHLILCCSLLLLSSIFPSISKALVTQLCPILSNPMNCSPPGSSVHGIFQARILESIAIFSSRGSSWPRDCTQVSCTAGRLFSSEPPGKPSITPLLKPSQNTRVEWLSVDFQKSFVELLNSWKSKYSMKLSGFPTFDS